MLPNKNTDESGEPATSVFSGSVLRLLGEKIVAFLRPIVSFLPYLGDTAGDKIVSFLQYTPPY